MRRMTLIREKERDGLSEFSEICSLIHTEWNLIQAPGPWLSPGMETNKKGKNLEKRSQENLTEEL